MMARTSRSHDIRSLEPTTLERLDATILELRVPTMFRSPRSHDVRTCFGARSEAGITIHDFMIL